MVLAGTGQSVTMNKFALDELDVRYDKDFFDVCIIHLTAKDEAFINEAYYQAKYILKNQGRLFIITRDQFSLSLSDSFTLLSEFSFFLETRRVSVVLEVATARIFS